MVLTSMYHVIKYSDFLDRLNVYFDAVSVFDTNIIEALAPLVPFEKFTIGCFLALDISRRNILKAAIILFGFFTLFLIDASQWYCAGIHFGFFMISMILLQMDNHSYKSTKFSKDSYQIV